MKNEELIAKTTSYILVLLPLLSLLMFVCMGVHSRYMSDDYNTAYNLATRGYWGMQVHYWMNWTGRYSFVALLGFVESFGPGIVPFLPGSIVILLYSTIGWTSYQLLKSIEVEKPLLISLSLAGLITWISIRSLFSYPEVLFWQTGIINYAVSPALIVMITGLLIKRLNNNAPARWGEIFFWLVLTVFCGGFSEGTVALQITCLGIVFFILAIRPFKNKRNILILIGTGLIGSFLSLTLMMTAPGNLARAMISEENIELITTGDDIGNMGGLILNTNLGTRILDSLFYACSLIPNWSSDRTVFASLALLGGIFIGTNNVYRGIRFDIKSAVRSFLTTGLIVLLAIWSAVAPSYVARGFAPPERALLLPVFFLVGLAVYSGWLSARILLALRSGKSLTWIRTGIAVVVTLFLLLGPGATLISSFKLLPVLETYADIWDNRDRYIRQGAMNGDRIIVVESIQKAKSLSELQADSIWKLGDFEEDPSYWVNQIAAQYYGVDKISAK